MATVFAACPHSLQLSHVHSGFFFFFKYLPSLFLFQKFLTVFVVCTSLQTGLRFFVHLFALLSLLSSNSIPSLKKQSKNDSSHLKSVLLTSTLIPDEHNDIMAKSMSSANE